jgi:hypothetical protein
MASGDYHFVTHWSVIGTLAEVADILRDTGGFPRWWPSVYLQVRQMQPGDEQGIGERFSMRTKGWLPYILDWEMRVTDSRYPHGFTLEAAGDLAGRGLWTFEQKGAWVEIGYDWWVRPGKPLIRRLTPLLKPAFSANHRWAMERGEEGLKLELARRRAASAVERARLPSPRPPTRESWALLGLPLLFAGAAVVGVLLVRRRRKRLRARRRFWRL